MEDSVTLTSHASTQPQLYVQTPLLRSNKLSHLAKANVWLKMETVQTSGSFKTRGLSNFAKKVSVVCPYPLQRRLIMVYYMCMLAGSEARLH